LKIIILLAKFFRLFYVIMDLQDPPSKLKIFFSLINGKLFFFLQKIYLMVQFNVP